MNQKRTNYLEHENAQQRWHDQVERARTYALTTFERNADRKGNFERGEHYEALIEWFDKQLYEANREINECVRAAELAEENIQSWRLRTVSEIGKSRDIPPIENAVGWSAAERECKDMWEFPPVPQREELGGRLGPFRWVRWLMRTESLALVSIVGLIGFGLLGAAASTIIRERGPQRPANTPLVSDLPSVIVRGVTAAVVVFLAVKGGLAIFALQSPDPNPYVLLLTC